MIDFAQRKRERDAFRHKREMIEASSPPEDFDAIERERLSINEYNRLVRSARRENGYK